MLGSFTVLVDGAPVERSRWQRPKAELVVKLLAAQPTHNLHREQLVDLLWPDLDPSAAANQLAKVLSFARRALEPDLAPNRPSRYFDTSSHRVRLCEVWVDADAFEQAAARALDGDDAGAHEAALALYAGDLLADDPYEAWAEERREQLRRIRGRLLRSLAAMYARAGRGERATPLFELMLAADPADEDAHRGLMRVYAATGDRIRALRQYETCVEALARELDAAPDDETIELSEAIASGAIALASATTRRTPTNLPKAATTFVGREAEVATVGGLLDRHRLVSLTGTGGVGKTRLAIEVASGLVDDYPGGVWFADLASIVDGALIARPLADSIGVRETPARPLTESVAAALADQTALVVVDNCEHVVESAAAFVGSLLRLAGEVRVLATSREPLGIAGERVWLVPSLDVPGADDPSAETAAVRLFRDRALLAGARLTGEGSDGAAIAEICRRLDGIPLAIELAAARARALSLDDLVGRLDDRFRLLGGARRDAVSRQQTLRAAIDWSYGLLTADERAVFNRLSVFPGGFGLDAAEAVCDDTTLNAATFDVLERLSDKSLVVVDRHGPSVRYRLLETLRAYGSEQLRRADDVEPAMVRLVVWSRALAGEARAVWDTPGEPRAMALVDAEHENVRAALRWCVEAGSTADLAVLCVSLAHFWDVRGHWIEARRWFDAAREAGAEHEPELRADLIQCVGTLDYRQARYVDAIARYEESLALRRAGVPGLAKTLYYLGVTSRNLGEHDRAEAYHRESLGLSERENDHLGVARASNGLGVISVDRGDYATGMERFERALGAFRRADHARGTAMLLHNMGEIAMRTGELARAERLLTASVETTRECGVPDLAADTTRALGYVALQLGDHETAVARYREALAEFVRIGDRRGLANAVGGLAFVAAAAGRGRDALLLGGASTGIREAAGYRLPPDEQELTNELLDRARDGIADAEASAIFDTGRAMSVEKAIAYALGLEPA